MEEEDNTICLFCRSDDKEIINAYLEKNPIEGLTKVVSINDAKKHYTQIKDKKQLLKDHSHFICDSRIAGQLYNILGSTFSSRNDYPVQINFTNPAQLPALIKTVIGSTYFNMAGKNISIRLGHTGMKANQVQENIMEGLPFAIEKLQNDWKDVHSIHLKTSDSASLPLYSKLPDEMLQYVTKQAANVPALATTTPAKSKKSEKSEKTPVATKTPVAAKTPVAEIKAPKSTVKATPSAVQATTPAVDKSSKKRKAEVAAEIPVASVAAVEVAVSSTPAPKSAMKKAKTPSAKEAAVVVPVTPVAPVEAPVSPKSTKKVAAPKSAKKTPGKAAAEVVEMEVDQVEETPRKSTRTPAKGALATPSVKTATKKVASARK